MSTLFEHLLKRIQSYSGSYSNLQYVKGLPNTTIQTLEQQWQVEFPTSMKAALSYWGKTVTNNKYKDKIVMMPHYGEMGLTSEQQMLAIYKLLLASNYQQKFEHDCVGVVENHLWNPQWIPVAAYASYSIHTQLSFYDLIVLDPISSLYQKIVHWYYRDGVLRIVAPSFQDYLERFYNDLEAMSWDPTYGFSF